MCQGNNQNPPRWWFVARIAEGAQAGLNLARPILRLAGGILSFADRGIRRPIVRAFQSPVLQAASWGVLTTGLSIYIFGAPLSENVGALVVGALIPAISELFAPLSGRRLSIQRRQVIDMASGPIIFILTQGTNRVPILDMFARSAVGTLTTLAVGTYGAITLGTGYERSIFTGSMAGLVGFLSWFFASPSSRGLPLGTQILIQTASASVGILIGSYTGLRAIGQRHRQDAGQGRALTQLGLGHSILGGGITLILAIGGYRAFGASWEALGPVVICFFSGLGGSLMGTATHFAGGRLAGDSIPYVMNIDRFAGFNIPFPTRHRALGFNFTQRRVLVNYDASDRYRLIVSRTTRGLIGGGRDYTARRLLTFVSEQEFDETAQAYTRGHRVFNDVFDLSRTGPVADVIALHGVGGYVFVTVVNPQGMSERTRPIRNRDFVEYLYHYHPELRDQASRDIPIRLLICFAGQSELPLSMLFENSLGQLMATRFGRRVYAGVTVIFPTPTAIPQFFHEFRP